MANYQQLKAAIDQVIKANGHKEITGPVLNDTLKGIVNSLGAGYQFMGVATPTMNPGTPDQNVFYIAGQAGTYTNFNSIALPDGVSILKWNGSWSSETVVAGDGVFDISAYKATGGTLATFADLSAALDGGNNIPSALRKGGMSVKFIQGSAQSSDNKYVQARCMAQNFTTDVTQWQGVDDKPTAGSKNLVTSGGVNALLANNNWIGKGNTFSSAIIKGLLHNNEYVLLLQPFAQDEVTEGSTAYGFLISSFDANGVETRLVGTTMGTTPRTKYKFTVPNNSAYIQVGGRANTGEKVLFNIFSNNEEIQKVSDRVNIALMPGVSILGKKELPNIDTVNHIIDFGRDPVLIIGNKTYVLALVHRSDPTKYRAVNYLPSVSSGAVVIVFNVATKEFSQKLYNSTFTEDDVIIGVIRLKLPEYEFIAANFPFTFTVDGQNVVVEEVTEELNKEIYFINGKAINTLGDIVDSSGTFISSKIPCNNGASVKWVYSKDQTVTVYLEAFDVNGEKLGNGYSSVNGSDGSRTMNINKPTVSYIIATFVDTTGYTPLVQINGVTVWEKEITLKGEVSLMHDQVDANTKQLQEYTYANLRTDIEVIAHRGVHINGIPENSIDAYRYAGYLGYDKAETDFCPTSDNVLVLMHDASINRTMRNASDYSAIAETVNVADKTYAELKAGYVLASTDIRYRRPIPTLEEYFKTCKESGVFPLPEIKTSGTTQEHVLKAFNMGCEILGEGNFGFCSFSAAMLDYVRTLSEITPLYYITGAIVDTVNSITGESRNDPYNVWYPQSTSVTEQNIKNHHDKGIKVVTWTIDVQGYDGQVKLGCDGVATDIIAPNISAFMRVGIKTDNGFDALNSNGVVTNNKLILNNGQFAKYSYLNNLYLGAFYLSVICQGKVTVKSNGLSATIETNEPKRYIFRGLIANGKPSFTITSSVDSSEIEFVEYYIQKF